LIFEYLLEWFRHSKILSSCSYWALSGVMVIIFGCLKTVLRGLRETEFFECVFGDAFWAVGSLRIFSNTFSKFHIKNWFKVWFMMFKTAVGVCFSWLKCEKIGVLKQLLDKCDLIFIYESHKKYLLNQFYIF
jgi:hypothetical protein